MKIYRSLVFSATITFFVSPALAQEQSSAPELQKLQEQHAKAIAEVEQESKAKIERINQQYDQSLDSLMQKLTRAGNLDGALAIREEKKRLAESIGTGNVSAGTSLAKNTDNPSTPSNTSAGTQNAAKSGENTIVEGKGWKAFHLGATRDELVKAFGQPDDGSTSDWLRWRKKYHIDCAYEDSRGAFELRFDEGFKDGLPTGIKVGSSEDKMRKEYGEPEVVTDKGNGAKKFEYSNKGILFWTNQGKITQIVVFKPI